MSSQSEVTLAIVPEFLEIVESLINEETQSKFFTEEMMEEHIEILVSLEEVFNRHAMWEVNSGCEDHYIVMEQNISGYPYGVDSLEHALENIAECLFEEDILEENTNLFGIREVSDDFNGGYITSFYGSSWIFSFEEPLTEKIENGITESQYKDAIERLKGDLESQYGMKLMLGEVQQLVSNALFEKPHEEVVSTKLIKG